MFPPCTVHQSNQPASVLTYVSLSFFTTHGLSMLPGYSPALTPQIFSLLLTSITLLLSPHFCMVSFPSSDIIISIVPKYSPLPPLLPNFSPPDGKTPLSIGLFLPSPFPSWRQTQWSSIRLFVRLSAVFDPVLHSLLLETFNTWLLGHRSLLMLLWPHWQFSSPP